MEIIKPIFIVGTGRSGSTAFQKVFSRHPALACLYQIVNSYPNKPEFNRLVMQALDWPVLGGLLKNKIRPAEPYTFWEYYCKGFRTPCRDLIAQDVTVKAKENLRRALSKTLTPKKNRLLAKITGWPRIGYLHEIFPDARFIHLVRDGRAVANSLINVDFWDGWKGPSNWVIGDISDTHRQEWENFDRSFVALAGIEWKIILQALEEAKTHSGKRLNLIEVRYEDLCATPIDTFKEIVRFCELDWSENFESYLRTSPLRSTNEKWQTELTAAQQRILEEVAHDYLVKYHYL